MKVLGFVRCGFTGSMISMISLLAATSAFAVCVDPEKASCEATIQAGVDAASAGETVKVADGLYLENVVIPAGKDGLEIKGSKGAILDGDLPNTGTSLTIEANDVQVHGISIHNGADGIDLVDGVSGVRIEKVTFRGNNGDCVNLANNNADVRIEKNSFHACWDFSIGSGASDNLRIRGNEFRACGADCIHVTGDGIVVEKNSFQASENDFIDIAGNSAEVVKNKARGSGGSAVRITGNDALVSRNKLTAADGDLIGITGDNAEVTKNKLKSGDTGINIRGGDPVVTKNDIQNTPGAGVSAWPCDPCSGRIEKNRLIATGYDGADGIEVLAETPGMTIRKNLVRNSVEVGIEANGPGVSILDNRVEFGGGASSATAILAFGTDSVVEGNSASDWMGDGIRVEGSGATVHDNKSFGNSQDGIDVDESATGVTVTDNAVKDNAGTGIEISRGATNAIVTGNKASGNRVDLCDEGTATTLNDNDVETTQLNTGERCPIGN